MTEKNSSEKKTEIPERRSLTNPKQTKPQTIQTPITNKKKIQANPRDSPRSRLHPAPRPQKSKQCLPQTLSIKTHYLRHSVPESVTMIMQNRREWVMSYDRHARQVPPIRHTWGLKVRWCNTSLPTGCRRTCLLFTACSFCSFSNASAFTHMCLGDDVVIVVIVRRVMIHWYYHYIFIVLSCSRSYHCWQKW